MNATPQSQTSRMADWLGLNRATLAVLAVIGCLGLSEEIWSSFLSLHLAHQAPARDAAGAVAFAVTYVGWIAAAKNLLEGFGYILGGTLAHRMGPRVALAVSAAPMAAGVGMMRSRGFSVWRAADTVM